MCFMFPFTLHAQQLPTSAHAMETSSIHIRDPFIYADTITKTYYLYASAGHRASTGGGNVVEAFTSKDLKQWQGPFTVFTTPENFWAQQEIWAPEVHHLNGRYYLFATFTSSDTLQQPSVFTLNRRATQIVVSDSPLGPFRPFENKPHTPPEWMSLDGTLYVEDGQPYMIFCHEWLQIKDGTVELIKLKKDLSATEGKPATLFTASQAPWVHRIKSPGNAWNGYVTDGPFLYNTKSGALLMLWSSFGDKGYAVGLAVSRTGKIGGAWQQQPAPLFKADGGHAMIFRTFTGQPMLVLHQPNTGPNERMKFFLLEERNGQLFLLKPID